jgi:hypothetical protein
MGMGFTFFRLPEEEPPFLEFLSKTGDLVAFPFEPGMQGEELLIPHPLFEYIAEADPSRVVISIRSIAVDPTTGRARGPSIHPVSAPTLSYTRGAFRDPATLGITNLAACSTVIDEHRRQVKQPDEFLAWVKKVMAWARRHAPVQITPGWRATEAVAARMKEGLKVEL